MLMLGHPVGAYKVPLLALVPSIDIRQLGKPGPPLYGPKQIHQSYLIKADLGVVLCYVQPWVQHAYEQGNIAMSGATSSKTPRLNLLPDFPGRKLIYHPLNSLAGEIRVIVVLHAAEREAPLRCFLKTISIHEGKNTEPYNAISYYWGSTENPETVEVYGGSWGHHQFGGSFKIPITSNLALVLRQFRAHATAKRQRLVIWTDALCINQTDTEERSAQVGVMRDIYKAAHGVWMWIGGTSLAAEMGLHLLYSYARYASNYRHSEVFTDFSPNGRLDRVLALQFGRFQAAAAVGTTDTWAEMLHRNITAFVSAAYWKRGWIIQEATANDNTYICYGPARYRIISWALLGELAYSLNRRRLGPLTPSTDDFIFQVRQLSYCQLTWDSFAKPSAEEVKQLRSWKSECPEIRYYLSTMFTANCWHTSDARDRVNAIMGAMPLYHTLGFQPDYSKSEEEVFTSATIHLLRIARSWSHLQFLAPSGSPYLPSWAIDFTIAKPFGYYDDQGHPSASIGLQVLRMYEQRVLETAGLIVDKVVSVSSLYTATLDRTDDVLRSWYRFLIQNKRYTRRNATLRGRARKWEAFCRTLRFGGVSKLKFDTSHAPASEALWDMVIYDRQRHPEDMRAEAQKLCKNMDMESSLLGTRFIVTRRGRIGVAPRGVSVGDSIGILASGDVPFVLHSVMAEGVPGGHAYILLGGCYIDGIMSGESVEEEAERRYGDKTATQRLFDESDLYLV
ncbi:hypothetical protein Q7P36_009160 [Cladosporium allicinum]